jgi:hypothetical protein
MDRGCSWQPYCISTFHGGHTGSGAGMTRADTESGFQIFSGCLVYSIG